MFFSAGTANACRPSWHSNVDFFPWNINSLSSFTNTHDGNSGFDNGFLSPCFAECTLSGSSAVYGRQPLFSLQAPWACIMPYYIYPAPNCKTQALMVWNYQGPQWLTIFYLQIHFIGDHFSMDKNCSWNQTFPSNHYIKARQFIHNPSTCYHARIKGDFLKQGTKELKTKRKRKNKKQKNKTKKKKKKQFSQQRGI